jgi:hypothetical protein
MLGWIVLLVWAYRRPLERRAIAVFTIFVVVGLVLAEVFAVLSGVFSAGRMAPTWTLQVLLVALFFVGFIKSRPQHRDVA